MVEFTSATLMSLVVTSVETFDPDFLIEAPCPDPMMHATTPGAEKAALLRRLVEKHGPGALLRIGQFLHLAEETPVVATLTRSSHPHILAEKWMRLERYQHSSHRTLIETTTGRWRCSRTSVAAPASRNENCLIAGVLYGLVTEAGAQSCRLEIGEQSFAPEELPSAALPSDEQFTRFSIVWRDDVATAAAPRRAVPDPERPLNDRLADLLASDIGRSWKIGHAARCLALSERTLQRQLRATGRSFTSILRRARMREATRLLTESDCSLAEIGYICGYADQAHFQRDFLRAANMTPTAFRRV